MFGCRVRVIVVCEGVSRCVFDIIFVEMMMVMMDC